ncbi:MAG TPA: alpha/beta hydrolase [Candidatus Saccharimonadales bacterium]|jgi:pimeloyl-ACP methyl ester carboxylesterase|nr:alpha/beta hydrolase [Candidatus Saccharimonadales bacterium]
MRYIKTAKSKILTAALALAFGLTGLIGFSGLASAHGWDHDGTPTPPNGDCKTIKLSVGLYDGANKDQTVAGTLCTPDTWASGDHQVDVLVHGMGYNSTYWNFPAGGYPQYSFVNRDLGTGRATLAYDQLGAGKSSHPGSWQLSLEAQGFVLHQVVQYAQGQGYTKVNAVGHSLGSAEVVQEAGTYNDVNKVVLTGMLHSVGSDAMTAATSFVPARMSHNYSGNHDHDGDWGYITTSDNLRSNLFYDHDYADGSVIRYDENHKDEASVVEAVEAISQTQTPADLNIAHKVTAPIYVLDGQQDKLFCGGNLNCASASDVQAHEASFYTSAASVTTNIVANTGHAIALHQTADDSFNVINGWLQ